MTDTATLSPEDIAALFTRSDDKFVFARWGRPIAPVIFGTNEQGAEIFGTALRELGVVAGHEVTEKDAEQGSNFLIFICQDWAELKEAEQLKELIPELDGLIGRLEEAQANQYRLFAFDEDGGIKICITLLRYDDELKSVSAPSLALRQAIMGMLLWSDRAFRDDPAILLDARGEPQLRTQIAALLKAAYDPVLPVRAIDSSFALRLSARMMANSAKLN